MKQIRLWICILCDTFCGGGLLAVVMAGRRGSIRRYDDGTLFGVLCTGFSVPAALITPRLNHLLSRKVNTCSSCFEFSNLFVFFLSSLSQPDASASLCLITH